MLEKFDHFASLWSLAAESGNSTGFLADRIMHMETGEVFGPDAEEYSCFFDFCLELVCQKEGRLPTAEEVYEIIRVSGVYGLDNSGSESLSSMLDIIGGDSEKKPWWKFW